MNIEEKSSYGISLVPIETKLLTERKIFISGDIDQKMSCEFMKQLLYLNMTDKNKRIDILVNSEGGEVVSGLVIYDAIKTSAAPIRTICFGKAYSMASVIFASATAGRIMLPDSKLMIHEPYTDGKIQGTAKSLESISEDLATTKARLNSILAQSTGKTVEEIESASAFDHYFTPEESLEFGLCDAIKGLKDLL